MAKADPALPADIAALRYTIGQILKNDSSVMRWDIDDIVAFAVGCPPSQLVKLSRSPVSVPIWRMARRLAHRRLAGTPTPLLTGATTFFGVPLSVKKGVLLPRPETELLVEAIIEWINATYPNTPVTILELGIGTGAISLSLAKMIPRAQVVGWDISHRAFTLAATNLDSLHLKNCMFYHGDFFKLAPLWINHTRQNDDPLIIVSNPPYIPTSVLATLDPSVQKNDPKRALDGGKSGLKFHQRLIQFASQLQAPLFLEMGYDQAMDIQRLADEYTMTCHIHHDYANHPRIAHIIPSK